MDRKLQLENNASVVMQKVIRGYLTRKKLTEAKEIYESIFSEVEEEDGSFQIVWEHNDNVCWPSASIKLKPNQEKQGRDVLGEPILQQSISQSADSIDSLLNEMENLICFQQRQSHNINMGSVTPKLSLSQPLIGDVQSLRTEGSSSSPALKYVEVKQSGQCSVMATSSYTVGPCRLCHKIRNKPNKEGLPIVQVQSLRSKSRCSSTWRPGGLPATTVDGTMFKSLSCCQRRSNETEDLSERALAYSSQLRQQAKVKATKRSKYSSRYHEDQVSKVPKNWPKMGIQSPAVKKKHSNNSLGDSSSSPLLVRVSAQPSPCFATLPASLPGRTLLSRQAECAVQTERFLEQCATITDVAVQTICETGVQTDNTTEAAVSTAETAVRRVAEALSPHDGCNRKIEDIDGDGSPRPVEVDDSADFSTTSPSQHSQQSPRESAKTLSHATDKCLQVAEVEELQLAAVTPLPSRSQWQEGQALQSAYPDASTPVKALDQEVTSTENNKECLENQSSIWSDRASPSADIHKDVTQDELKAMKEKMSMELMWIEQAIASRKQYISLVKSMANEKKASAS